MKAVKWAAPLMLFAAALLFTNTEGTEAQSYWRQAWSETHPQAIQAIHMIHLPPKPGEAWGKILIFDQGAGTTTHTRVRLWDPANPDPQTTEVTLRVPASANVLPPGYYMLFVLRKEIAGAQWVPSEAVYVKVDGGVKIIGP